ncbi:ATP-dependent helicase HrpB [Litoribrevibacter euphylliae]|uniref:ATP-dependent helicase HrpB n=1 Tax=Litoribrevibacter euphylliae TaxID=1834034 RepID=A0ABV7HEW8_9GAMM
MSISSIDLSAIDLPISTLLPAIKDALTSHDQLIIEAAPGAGKTTVVPLSLLDLEGVGHTWIETGKILMLEPRRIAARQAAERMAQLLNEEVGETVGYRVRMDKKVSDKTRIEVITEGVLNRMLLEDPSLDGIAAVIFDEFHERSLDGDLGLALTLQGRQLFGELREHPLKVLVMSATLDGTQIQSYIERASEDTCPILSSEGRAYPVEVIWQTSSSKTSTQSNSSRFKQSHFQHSNHAKHQALVDQVSQCVEQALADQTGSILVFLPGQREIQSVREQLVTHLGQSNSLMITPLYGALSLAEQRKAIEPAPQSTRKIVLTTSIAETSLTIEGVRVVIDSGLARVPEYDPKTAMTRLKTERVSKASAKQRAGRAGRLEAGVCYRLWSEEQHQSLANFAAPEIDQADLAPVALQLIQWGLSEPTELDWLTPPKTSAYNQAVDLLRQLEAISEDGATLTTHGEAMVQLAMHPRLAHMLIKSRSLTSDSSQAPSEIACQLAALLSERDPINGNCELAQRLTLFNNESKQPNSPLIKRIKQLAKQFEQQLKRVPSSGGSKIHVNSNDLAGILTSLAYPDRIAQRAKEHLADKITSDKSTSYKLSNGRQAQIPASDPLTKEAYLAVAQLGGQSGQTSDRVFLAAPLNLDALKQVEPSLFQETVAVEWSNKDERLLAEQRTNVGKLICESKALSKVPSDQKETALLNFVKSKGLDLLTWTPELKSWCQRIELLRSISIDQEVNQQTGWPDMSEQGLLDSLQDWLAPYLTDISHINHFKKLDLKNILAARLPWPLPKELDEQAPERIRVPSGSNIKIDYSQNPPILAVKLQEMFGQTDTPSIANGKVKLLVHLLSPAQRPLQVTQDLAGFWNSSYELVKKDMKGRYPKHHWPDNPLEAEATARAKPRKG